MCRDAGEKEKGIQKKDQPKKVLVLQEKGRVSTDPLGNTVVIHKTFLLKQALETVPLPNFSVKWQISICR